MFKILSAAILAIALVIGVLRPDLLLTAEERQAQNAINSLRSIANRAQVHYSRLAIGYNTNVDLIADAVGVLGQLGANPAAASPHPYSSIRSLKEFRDTFAKFFSEGSAAERFIENAALCQEIVEATQRVPGATLLTISCIFLRFSSNLGCKLLDSFLGVGLWRFSGAFSPAICVWHRLPPRGAV